MALRNDQVESDAEVVVRVQAGETGLYELLMRRYNQRLFRVVRSIVSDDQEAEDIVQDAWVRAFEHLDQFEGRASFATWVTKIAVYEALHRSRENKKFTALEDKHGELIEEAEHAGMTAHGPETQAMQSELGRLLQSAIDRLPVAYRSVFMLHEVEQLSTAETAECLNVSEEAVKTRLHRSRALLRQDLECQLGPAIAASYAFMGERCDRTVAAVMERCLH